MIKVFTDKAYLNEQYRKMIFPLLFDLYFVRNTILSEKFELVTTIEECEVVIVPIDIAYYFKENKKNLLFELINEGNRIGKKVWVFTAGDFGLTLKKDVYTFRLGGFNSKLDLKTFILPAYAIDPYTVLKREFMAQPKNKLPIIGFVGHADNSILGQFKEFLMFLKLKCSRFLKSRYLDSQPFFPSGARRFWFLKQLQRDSGIVTNFIFRKQYRAGAKTNVEREKTTIEFFDNMFDSPYVFCLRGVGNFSVRLYETLAMGRIPIIIDTDIRLPLEEKIDWHKHCIIGNADDYINKTIEFHKNISESDFKDIQTQNRELWLNYLNRVSYFDAIHSVFKSK